MYDKYGLDKENEYIILFYPKNMFISVILKNGYEKELFKFIENLSKLKSPSGKTYKLLVKARCKETAIGIKKINYHKLMIDIDFYPLNTTELLSISSLCIFFSSSVVEECVFTKTPFMSFDVDKERTIFKFLYDNKICIRKQYEELGDYRDIDKLQNNVLSIIPSNRKIFDQVIKNHSNHDKNISKRFVDFMLNLK